VLFAEAFVTVTFVAFEEASVKFVVLAFVTFSVTFCGFGSSAGVSSV
jgi:hypothetical protein